MTNPDADPARLRVVMVSGEFFNLFGATPILGRTLGMEDQGAGKTAYALLSHSAWMNRFNGDEDIVGQAVTLDGNPVEGACSCWRAGRSPRGIARLVARRCRAGLLHPGAPCGRDRSRRHSSQRLALDDLVDVDAGAAIRL